MKNSGKHTSEVLFNMTFNKPDASSRASLLCNNDREVLLLTIECLSHKHQITCGRGNTPACLKHHCNPLVCVLCCVDTVRNYDIDTPIIYWGDHDNIVKTGLDFCLFGTLHIV